MKLYLRIVCIASFFLLVFNTHGQASTILLATLTNAAENPPTNPTTTGGIPRPASYGYATFVLNDAQTAMTFTATIFNIDFTGSQRADVNDNLVAAHIHASPTVTATTNAGVVWGSFGKPFNDNNPNDVVNTPFATGMGGTISGKWDAPEGNGTTLAAQLANILTGTRPSTFTPRSLAGARSEAVLRSRPSPRHACSWQSEVRRWRDGAGDRS